MIKLNTFFVSAGVVSAALLVGFSAKAIIMIDPDAIPACTANDWTCTDWSACSAGMGGNYSSSRTCTATINCLDTNNTKPKTSHSSNINSEDYICPPAPDQYSPAEEPQQQQSKPACTADQWTCTAWGECEYTQDATQQSSRTCTPTVNCDPNSATKPAEYHSGDCQLPADSYSQNPSTGANTSRMIIINSNIDSTGLWPSASINQDKGLFGYASVKCTSNTLIKTEDSPAVYYCGQDGKRYVFPNEKTYYSWYSDFSSVTIITPDQLAAIPIGGNVTYRSGMRMIKVTSSPTVYAVGQGGVLRPISSEAVAVALYGADWNTKIDDISDAFFVNYTTGAELDLN